MFRWKEPVLMTCGDCAILRDNLDSARHGMRKAQEDVRRTRAALETPEGWTAEEYARALVRGLREAGVDLDLDTDADGKLVVRLGVRAAALREAEELHTLVDTLAAMVVRCTREMSEERLRRRVLEELEDLVPGSTTKGELT